MRKRSDRTSYTADWKDLAGVRQRVECVTPEAARILEHTMLIEKDLVKHGVISLSEVRHKHEAKRLIEDQIRDFAEHKYAIGVGQEQVQKVTDKIRAMVAWTGITSITELDPCRIEAFVNSLPWCNNTKGKYLEACKGFARWLDDVGHTGGHMLKALKVPRHEEPDKERHAFTPEEACDLLQATLHKGKTYQDVTGYDRHIAYWIALTTGARWSEILRLRMTDFDLNAVQPSVILPGIPNGKQRTTVRMWLTQELGIALRKYREQYDFAERIHGMTSDRAKNFFQRDVALAGLPHEFEDRSVANGVHCLRHTFITWLVKQGHEEANEQRRRQGKPPQKPLSMEQVRQLARHASIMTTMKYYVHWGINEFAGAVIEGLPSMGPKMDEGQQATA